MGGEGGGGCNSLKIAERENFFYPRTIEFFSRKWNLHDLEMCYLRDFGTETIFESLREASLLLLFFLANFTAYVSRNKTLGSMKYNSLQQCTKSRSQRGWNARK